MERIDNQPTFFGAIITQTPPTYDFTADGFSCTLRCGNRSVFWQGDEAEEIGRRIDRDGPACLAELWDEYEHVATEDEA